MHALHTPFPTLTQLFSSPFPLSLFSLFCTMCVLLLRYNSLQEKKNKKEKKQKETVPNRQTQVDTCIPLTTNANASSATPRVAAFAAVPNTGNRKCWRRKMRTVATLVTTCSTASTCDATRSQACHADGHTVTRGVPWEQWLGRCALRKRC